MALFQVEIEAEVEHTLLQTNKHFSEQSRIRLLQTPIIFTKEQYNSAVLLFHGKALLSTTCTAGTLNQHVSFVSSKETETIRSFLSQFLVPNSTVMRNEELFSLKVSYILHFHKAKATSNIDSYCKFFPYGKLRASMGEVWLVFFECFFFLCTHNAG